MKKKFSFVVALVATVCSVFVTSCSNEINVDALPSGSDSDQEIKLVKSPEFKLSSGSLFNATFNATQDVQVNVNYFKIQDFPPKSQWNDWMIENRSALYNCIDNAPAKTDRDEQVSQAEYEFVMAYLADHPNEGSITCDLTTYFIQNVGSSKAQYHLAFMNGDNVHHYTDITGGNQMDYVEFNSTHINDYNAVWGPRALCVNIPLVNPRYHDSYYNTTQENHYRFYVIEFNGKKNLYLCFDYATYKYDNGLLDYKGDGVYNDWVIKIIPGDGSEIAPDEPDPVIPDPVIPDPEDPDPEDPDPYDFYTTDHVEINLSLNDKHEEGDWIHTKLSIHIRAVTDVEVFIPVASEYYCALDDMDIVISHQLDLVKYIPQPTTENYTIVNANNGESYQVSATVAFESNGIRITTQGMTAELQEYLQETYGDGLTFEIWNYYNVDSTNREQLKPFLDQSSVTFTSDPTLYVNAFAGIEVDDNIIKNPLDCIVTPPSAYTVWYERTYETYYDYNVLYKKQ